ncbi:MAG TPA: 6-pyruvoyl-tetrahydropterin synthase-related protein, partial [Anaerolineae bacterium]
MSRSHLATTAGSSLPAPRAGQNLVTRFAGLRWGVLGLILALPAIYPAITRNIAAIGWDAATEHVLRGVVFSQIISEGTLFPRWAQFLHLGLGSPLFTFLPPLPYYGMDLLFRLSIPHPVGWRILIVLGLLAAYAGAYSLVHLLTGRRWPAILAAVAYLYAPYVLFNALERGSTEAFSMFLYPWVLWGLVWVALRPSAARFTGATLLWAACIGSHVLGPLMLAPLALLLALGLAFRHRTLLPMFCLLVGGLLTAGIWAPMIPEQGYVHVERDFNTPETQPESNPIPLERLLTPMAIFDVQRGNNGSADRVGVVHVALLAAGLPLGVWAWAGHRRKLAVYLGGAALAGALLFWLFTPAADTVWRLGKPLLGHLLYRTRLLGAESLAAAVAGGLIVALLSQRKQPWVSLALACIIIILALPSLYVELLHPYADFGTQVSLSDIRPAEIEAGGSALTAFGEFTPRWHEGGFDPAFIASLGPAQDAAVRPLAGEQTEISINSAVVRSGAWDLDLNARQPVTATLYLLYYPRWQAWIDGRPVSLTAQPSTGLAQLALPAGNHRVTLRYGTTTAETAGLAISGLVLLALLLALVWSRLRRQAMPAPDLPGAGSDWQIEPAPTVWLLVVLAALVIAKATYVDRETTWLRCVSTATFVCGAQTTANASFQGGPRLRGYTLSTPSARAGGQVVLSLVWEAEQGKVPRLTSFVHVRNSRKDQPIEPESGSDIWAQANHLVPGGILTRDYQGGKLYVDE